MKAVVAAAAAGDDDEFSSIGDDIDEIEADQDLLVAELGIKSCKN